MLKHEQTKLELLDLSGTQVTDTGLAQLHALTNLRTLHLGRTKISSEGIKKIKAASSHRVRVHQVDFSHLQSEINTPANESSYVSLGNTLMSQGRTAEAKAYFVKALEFQPNRKEAHFGLAQIRPLGI